MFLISFVVGVIATQFCLALGGDFEKAVCEKSIVEKYRAWPASTTEANTALLAEIVAINNEYPTKTITHLSNPKGVHALRNVVYSLTCDDGILRSCSYVCRAATGSPPKIISVHTVKDRETASFTCGRKSIALTCGATPLENGATVAGEQ